MHSCARSQAAGRGPATQLLRRRHAEDLPPVELYYDLLKPLCAHVDLWHTVYNHVMAGPQGIVEWFKGSGLRPFLSALDDGMREAFLAAYLTEIGRHYATRFDGKVLLRFPRLFIVARK